ncbi:hypothetical protein [Denitromonas iodatirespirans]|uniref:J domain-containing protein n=1 Tax=Denitromonas iodatirespirans TaxID=2795389 RepID=A0A944DFX7_DENI1|nr:hypothetical protein [Denitromonas iodatirespirans]MBT0962073.1 hypothetical protein [Denitromonas iodatirespirans]
MTTKARTLYDILQLSPKAEPAMIKAAHVLLSRRLEAQGDTAALRLLNDAFATLNDPTTRAAYDERIAELPPPLPPVARPAAGKPMWSRVLTMVLALAVGYVAAAMWHQRALTAMVLDHQAALADKQAELTRVQMEQVERRQAASQERYATREEQRAKERQAQQEARELAALRNRLDRDASDYQRTKTREEQQREREAQRRVEQERAARAAEAERNAMLAERRLAEEKRELDRLYREKYPQYR